MNLSILDMSPVVSGTTPATALADTLHLAQRADQLGYGRYWVAEHHNDPAFAHASPEILIPRLAAATERIRVGAGGILLSHYAPFKVAEQFNLLETMFPDRIDLGIGRAGGGEGRSDEALRNGGVAGFTHWEKVAQLLGFIGHTEGGPWPDVQASPPVDREPEVWILGTSLASARWAAEHGLRYAFGGFVDPRNTVEALHLYKQSFRPSARLAEPYAMLAWVALAAETAEEARELGRSAEIWFVRSFLRGGVSPFPTLAEAHDEKLTPEEETVVAWRRQGAVVGTGEQVAAALSGLQQGLGVAELMLVTLTSDPAHRLSSFERLAAAL